MSCIALLTDFGTEDWFVGTMKGVIATINPKAQVVDLCHDIPPGDIRAGAFALLASYRYFPRGTIFVAVVDPGVGGPREAILAEAHGCHFIGPDNGLLSFALAGGPPGTGGARQGVSTLKPATAEGVGPRMRIIENPAYRLPGTASTFHGRDVFAPAAAHLSLGKSTGSFGKRKEQFTELLFPVPYKLRGTVAGLIVHVDRFGNAITNLTPRDLEALPEKSAAKGIVVKAKGKAFPLAGYYSEAALGKPLSVAGSSGFLELSVNGGNAAKRFGLKRGDAVKIG
ncbi:MAG: SAM-dependent chlorinase/fluorinase [Fibrobacterota bacterium]|nr:SAM-dependent chlorinase/fluorinase [Fibrobacterota bacterium]